jgi:hypothetical protein
MRVGESIDFIKASFKRKENGRQLSKEEQCCCASMELGLGTGFYSSLGFR